MAIKQEFTAMTGDQSKQLGIATQKLKLIKGDFNDAAFLKPYQDPVLKKTLLLPTFNQATGKFDKESSSSKFLKEVSTGNLPLNEEAYTKFNLQRLGVTDFNLTPEEKALVLNVSKDPGLAEDFTQYADIISDFSDEGFDFQFGPTGRTFDTQTGAIFNQAGQQIPGISGGQEKQFGPKPVSQTGSLQGTMGVAGVPSPIQAPQMPQQPVQPQNVYGQILTLPNGQKIDPTDPNYGVFAKQMGLQPPEETIIQGKAGFEGLEANKKTNIVNGLNAAWQRLQDGTANEADKKNLDYAQKIGIWSPPDVTSDMSSEEKDLFDAEKTLQGDFNLQKEVTGEEGEPTGIGEGIFSDKQQKLFDSYEKLLAQTNKPATDAAKKLIEALSSNEKTSTILDELSTKHGEQAVIDELAKLDKLIQPYEDALENLPQDIADRYEDIGLTEAQRRRRLVVESNESIKQINILGDQMKLAQNKLTNITNQINRGLLLAMSDRDFNLDSLQAQYKIQQDLVADNKAMLDKQFELAFEIAQQEELAKANSAEVNDWAVSVATGAAKMSDVPSEYKSTVNSQILDMFEQGLLDLTEGQKDDINKLSGALKTEPLYKSAIEVQNGFQNLKVGYELNNAQGDLAIVNGMAKMLDPTGVVRPAEFDTVESAQGFLQKFMTLPAKFQEGDRLHVEARKAFFDAGVSLFNEKVDNFNNTVGKVYQDKAEAFKIPFNLVGVEFNKVDPNDFEVLSSEAPDSLESIFKFDVGEIDDETLESIFQ